MGTHGLLENGGNDLAPALCLREASPDTVGLLDVKSVHATLGHNRTDLTDGLCSRLTSDSFLLALLSTRGKKQVGVVPAAQRHRLP